MMDGVSLTAGEAPQERSENPSGPSSNDIPEQPFINFDIIDFKDDDEINIPDSLIIMNPTYEEQGNSVSIGSHPSSDHEDQRVVHRRTISSPMLAFNPPSIHTPIYNLPVAQSKIEMREVPKSRLVSPLSFIDPISQMSNDSAYMTALLDQSLIINPVALRFIPEKLWPCRDRLFGDLVSDFFQRKNNVNSRFSYKLYNALRLVQFNEAYVPLVGVKWLNEFVLRVDKRAFARLIGIKSIDGSLFHQQGNFPSHGFVEISAGEVPQICPGVDLTGVDFDAVRLLYHSDHLFIRGCTEKDIESCKWGCAKKKEDL